MGRAIKAEIRKLFTVRLWWGMAIAVVVIAAGLAALFAGVIEKNDNSSYDIARTAYTAGAGFGYLLLLVIGIMTIGMEYRHKTITSALLATPNRVNLIMAKVVALIVFGVLYGVLYVLAALAGGAAVLASRGVAIFPQPGDMTRTLLLMLLVLALWALIGLGIGILIPNQVAAILVGVALAFIVEPIVGNILANVSWGEAVSKYFPSRATSAILGAGDGEAGSDGGGEGDLLSWWQGSIVLVAYAAIMAGVGTVLTKRKDVL